MAGERLLPQFEPELLGPAIEPAACTIGRQQGRPEPAVAAREDAFQKRQPRVVPFELDAVAAQFAAQQALARLGFVQIHLPRPLERRMRFRDEGRDAGRHLPLMFAGRGHLAAQLDDAEQVFLGLGRLAEHEIQFHALPAESEQQPRRVDQLVFLILLLDHVAQPLGAGLGRQREAGFPHAADLLQDVRRERVHARGRQRDRHFQVREAVHHRPQQRIHAAIVPGAQAQQRDFFVPALPDQLFDLFLEGARVAFAQRPVDVAGLAEPAAAHAAAHDLDGHPVMHDVDVGHDLGGELGDAIQICDHALFHAGAVRVAWANRGEAPARSVCGREQRRHVETRNVAQGAQQVLPVPTVPRQIGVTDIEHRLLAVPEQKAVDEVGDGLRVKRAWPAGDDQRMVRAAVSRMQRDAAHIEHRQHVRVGEFVLEAEADDVECVQRPVGFERHEREVVRAQLPLHVGPGRVRALGLHVCAAVQQVVQNLEAEV